MDYETVIGLEVHVQLLTDSKIFCAANAHFGADPNEHIDPLTFGLPGALPVLNKKTAEFAILLGLALHCQIRKTSRFARKHYFYPDLPKGYQISQYDEPLCEKGHLDIQRDGTNRTIGITRVHIEEDAGKNIHDSRTNSSLVDLNRAGVPLLEVVSEPDLRSPAEAAQYIRTLRQIVRYLGISDGNMEEGSLRCDANISLRPLGTMDYGTRTEIKNINSFRFVEKALEYEVARQVSVLKNGGAIEQETRLYDNAKNVTRSMRSKEESSDYRYFPDPDLPPLIVEESWVNSLRESMTKLPGDYFRELVSNFELSEYDAGVLVSERAYIDYFLKTNELCNNPKTACNWITSELFGYLKKEGKNISHSPITPESLGTLIKLVDQEVISGKMAKTVFEEMFETGKSPEEIIDARGLRQITSAEQIREFVLQVIRDNEKQFQEYAGGQDRLHGFFVGQVMKMTKGNANPKIVNELILEELQLRKTSNV